MLYVGLCRDYHYGDILYVVDDIDCMSEGLLDFPGLEEGHWNTTVEEVDMEAPIEAARQYILKWNMVDEQSPPLHITVNTSLVSWEGQALINGDKLKLVDAYEEEDDG